MQSAECLVLGTGTSTGIPTIGCDCTTCQSDDIRDKRLRCSILIRTDSTSVLIDTTPDFRQQMLKFEIRKLDAVLFTHQHYDHIGGFDDLRPYNYLMKKPIPIYSNDITYEHLLKVFEYAFIPPEQIGGGVPEIINHIVKDESFNIGDLNILPLKLYHGKMEVLGFRIGNFAYCTDTNNIPESTIEKMYGLDYLIIDALRYHEHSTHFCLKESLEIINKLNPKQAYLTHIAHQIKHSECDSILPENVRVCFDGLKFCFNT